VHLIGKELAQEQRPSGDEPKREKKLCLPLNLNNFDQFIVKGEFFLEDNTGEYLKIIYALKIEYEECNCADIPWSGNERICIFFIIDNLHVYLGEITTILCL